MWPRLELPNDPGSQMTGPRIAGGFLGGARSTCIAWLSVRYVSLLRARDAVPRIVTRDGQDRMLILPGEDTDASTSIGRPIGSEYWDGARKLAFMDRHGIALSVVSPADPWLDFLPGTDAGTVGGRSIRTWSSLRRYWRGADLRSWSAADTRSQGRGVGIGRIARLPHLRGAVIGTIGAGNGLDDRAMDPVWAAAERDGLMLLSIPLRSGQEAMGGYGHAMALALVSPSRPPPPSPG